MLVYQRVTKTNTSIQSLNFLNESCFVSLDEDPDLMLEDIPSDHRHQRLAVMRIDRGIGRLSPVESEGCAQSVQPPGDIPPCLVSRLAGVLPALP